MVLGFPIERPATRAPAARILRALAGAIEGLSDRVQTTGYRAAGALRAAVYRLEAEGELNATLPEQPPPSSSGEGPFGISAPFALTVPARSARSALETYARLTRTPLDSHLASNF